MSKNVERTLLVDCLLDLVLMSTWRRVTKANGHFRGDGDWTGRGKLGPTLLSLPAKIKCLSGTFIYERRYLAFAIKDVFFESNERCDAAVLR